MNYEAIKILLTWLKEYIYAQKKAILTCVIGGIHVACSTDVRICRQSCSFQLPGSRPVVNVLPTGSPSTCPPLLAGAT